MKPRELADKQIEAMNIAAQKTWDKYCDRLEVTDRQEGKKFCWQHVRNHFAKWT